MSIVPLGPGMKDRELEEMELGELWNLHERIVEVLNRRLENEKHQLQSKLDELGRKFGQFSTDFPQRRRYRKVEPKFRNPDDLSQTWSGRGKIPRWLAILIASG